LKLIGSKLQGLNSIPLAAALFCRIVDTNAIKFRAEEGAVDEDQTHVFRGGDERFVVEPAVRGRQRL
jgi:hypothetical protein